MIKPACSFGACGVRWKPPIFLCIERTKSNPVKNSCKALAVCLFVCYGLHEVSALPLRWDGLLVVRNVRQIVRRATSRDVVTSHAV